MIPSESHKSANRSIKLPKLFALTLPVPNEIALVLCPHMLIDQPFAAALQQRVKLLDDLFWRRNRTQALNSDDRVDALLLNPTFTTQFLRATPDNLIDVTQPGFDSALAQLRMHSKVGLDTVDLGDAAVIRLAEEVKPLARPGPDVETDPASGILEERHHARLRGLTRLGPEELPEACEPGILEVFEGLEDLEIQIQDGFVDRGYKIEGGIAQQEERSEEIERTGLLCRLWFRHDRPLLLCAKDLVVDPGVDTVGFRV